MDEMDRLWQEARAIADRALGQIASLEARRNEIDEELKQARAFVRRVAPTARRKKRAAPPSKTELSDRKLLEVAEAIDRTYTDDDATFAAPHVATMLGQKTTDSARKALRQLRDMEFIAKAGERRIEGQRGGMPHAHYRVLDRQVIDQLRSEL